MKKSIIMWSPLTILTFFCLQALANAKQDTYNASDIVNLSSVDILKLRGFETEVHFAPTLDGYKIHLVHVINPKIDQRTVPLKRPIIFNHGFLESSTIWLINSRNVTPTLERNLCSQEAFNMETVIRRNDSINGPMMLANYAYDVWLMSMRGTDFSLGHKTLKANESAYWDYSLDNFALGDIPAAIEYVRQYTGAKKVAYAGHSQATFSIFALLAKRPDYADIIEPVFALAPVAYMHHTNSIARPLFLASLTIPLMNGPFPREAKAIRENFAKNCLSNFLPFQFSCRMLDAITDGRGRGALPGYFSHMPFRSSVKVVRHFGQIIAKKNFTSYDHGPDENKKRYGTKEAPLYRIRDIRSKSLCLFSTETDTLAHPEDVKLFRADLQVPLLKDIYIKGNFNHIDIITHKDAGKFVFGPMLEILERFEHDSGICSIEKSNDYTNSDDYYNEPSYDSNEDSDPQQQRGSEEQNMQQLDYQDSEYE